MSKKPSVQFEWVPSRPRRRASVFVSRCVVKLLLVCVAMALGACSSRHEELGFSSRMEMRGAHANGVLTKARMIESMTPLPVPTYQPPGRMRFERRGERHRAVDLVQLCGSAHSCALAITAAAAEANLPVVQAGVLKVLSLPQQSRGGGSTLGRTEFEKAQRISQLSRSRKSVAYEVLADGLHADPRSSGLWLGMAVHQALHGTREDAWAAAWLSWYFAGDRAQAVERIRLLFYAETNQVVRSLYGPALAWINTGRAPHLN